MSAKKTHPEIVTVYQVDSRFGSPSIDAFQGWVEGDKFITSCRSGRRRRSLKSWLTEEQMKKEYRKQLQACIAEQRRWHQERIAELLEDVRHIPHLDLDYIGVTGIAPPR